MSAPSFSSFPPTFSSFPDLEEGPSTGVPSRKRSPREKDVSTREHHKNKGHRSKRDEREQDDHRSSRQHEGREQSKHRRKHDRHRHDSLEESISNATSSPLYFSDSKGDALNITYGALHSGSVPRYHAINGGRRVLGLSSALSVVTNTGKEVVVAPRDRHKVPQLTDSRTRLVLDASKPRRFVVSEKLASQYEEVDGFIPILRRVGDMHTQDYRRIDMKGSPNSDSGEPTSDESNASDEDQDVYTLSSREKLLKDLEQRVQQNPRDVSIWLELLVRSQVDSHSATNYKAQAEIEVAILSRAFKAHQDNTLSSALWIKYLTACERIRTDAQVSAAWADAMRQVDCPDLSMTWLNWRLRRTASSVEETLQDAATVFGKRWSALSDEDQDKVNLRLLWRIGVFLNQAGYNERAYALFQAESHLLFKLEQTATWEKRIEDLEAFWESEDQRIGDIECADRSDLGLNTVSDVFTHWASHEGDQDRKHFIPRRVEDGDDDPYSTVLFSEIQPFLVNIRTRHGLRLFRQIWLYFLGLRTPGLLASLSEVVSDAAWAESSFCSGVFLDMLFPQHSSQGSLVESVAGALVGRERAYRDSFGIVREWGYGLLCPLEGVLPDDRIRCWETFCGHVDAIRRIFTDLRFDGEDDEWDELSLAFDLAVDPKRATKQCKQLLSHNDRSVRLWGAQARLTRARGKLDEARKVYGMVLQTLSEETEESFVLWWDYAEMLWLDDRRDDALSVILRSCGQAEGGNTLAVLRAKRRLEELVANYEADFSKRRVTLCVLRSRMLLEILTTSALHSTIELGRRYLKTAAGESWLHEGATMALLVLIYHYTVTLRNPVAMKLLRDLAHEAIKDYPDNTVVLGVLLESEKGEAVWGRVRRVLAEPGPGLPDKSVVRKISEIWAAGWVVGRWSGEVESIRASLEAAVVNSSTRGPVLWRIFVEFEIRFGRSEQAKATLLRTLGECPYNKELYLLAFGPLRRAFKSRELAMLAETMAEKGLRLRGSIEELIGSGGDDDMRVEGGIADEGEDEIVERAKELRRLMPY